MSAKELKETLKQVIFVLQFVLLFSVILPPLLKTAMFDIFFPLFQTGLLFLALLLGNFTFSLEREQRGLEYLLSLPYTRMQLLGYKFIPRLGAVVLLYFVHLIIYNLGGSNSAALSIFGFTLLYTALFLIAFSLSAVSDNFVLSSAVSALFLFISMYLLMLVFKSAWLLKGVPLFPDLYLFGSLFSGSTDFYKPFFIWSVSLIMLAAFIAAFVRAFKSFDIRPARTFNKKYFQHLLVWLPAGFILAIIFVYFGTGINIWTNYYLTEQNILLEKKEQQIYLHTKDHTYQIEHNLRLWPAIEIDNTLITIRDDTIWNQKPKFVISRLDLKSAHIESLYEASYKKSIGWPHLTHFENQVHFFEKGKSATEIELVFLDLNSSSTRRFSINLPAEKHHSPRLIGTDKIAGARFWLVSLRHKQTHAVLQVWEDGQCENLALSRSHIQPSYINRMLLIYTEKGVQFSRITQTGLSQITELPGIYPAFSSIRKELTNIPLTELYGRQGEEIIRLDLESFQVEGLGSYNGWLRKHYPNTNYFVQLDREKDIQKIYSLQDGKMNYLMELILRDPKKYSSADDSVYIFRTGIVTRSKGKVRVFSLPDLQELKFKGLSP